MSDDIAKLMDDYVRWIKDKTVLKQVDGDWIEITSPHLDRHNDCIQLYVKKQNGGFVLTDDGYTLNDLRISGCPLDSDKRQELLKSTLAGFGVKHEANDRLTVHATAENFPLKKHNLMQAMLAVNDLFYLATPMVQSLYYEDVQQWLENSDIRYTPGPRFTGKSGYDHMFDFVIPKSRRQPERMVQAVTNPKKDSVSDIMFKWNDTKDTRPTEAKLYAMLNDTQSRVSAAVVDAFRNCGAEPVLWSQRESVREALTA